MSYALNLPKDKEQREEALTYLVNLSEQGRRVQEINWWYVHYYMQGARNFTNVNYELGSLDVQYTDNDGILRFKLDDILSKFQSQLGRLYAIDLAPRATRKSTGLDDLRKASIAQVCLDAAFSQEKVELLKSRLWPPLLKFGLVGLLVWGEGDEVGIDVVMPWELVPLPPNPMEKENVRGLARVRYVPLDWVKSLEILHDTKIKWEEVDTLELPAGVIPQGSKDQFSVAGQSAATLSNPPREAASQHRKRKGSTKAEDQTKVKVVRLTEVWTESTTGHLQSYDILVGQLLAYTKEDYAGSKLTIPLQVCTDIPTGNFWGRSFCSTLIPLNSEMEYTIGRLLQNIQDIDMYGLLCLPSTLGINPSVMRGADGLKRVVYEPDYTAPEQKPFNIQPANAGLLPVKVAEFGMGLMSQIANQPNEMMSGQAPGRVDSSAGLGFLYEVSNTPLTPSAASVATAISNCYKAMLGILQTKWGNDKVVELNLLDDSLAGIILDASAGVIQLSQNTIPSPNEVNISVRSLSPRSPEKEKQELAEALKLGIIDMFEYRVEVRKRGLEIPVGSETEWQNYRRAMLENLVLFKDGQTPGQVTVDEVDMHQIHLRILQAFMARPEYFQAGEAVRTAFKQHYQAHQAGLGIMPEGAPMPEEAATEAEMMMKQGGMGGGMPPMGMEGMGGGMPQQQGMMPPEGMM